MYFGAIVSVVLQGKQMHVDIRADFGNEDIFGIVNVCTQLRLFYISDCCFTFLALATSAGELL